MIRIFLLLLALLLGATGAEAASRFARCATTCTWDGSSTAMWSATSGGATGASVPVSTDDVTIDNNTCTGGTTCAITVNTNFNINTLTFSGCNASTTGCVLDFSVNNNNVTIQSSYTDTGTNNASIKFGSATINIVATGGGQTAWAHTSSGVVFTPGTSNINISGTQSGTRTFSPGPGSYASINFLANTGGGFMLFSTGTATIANLSVTGPNNVTWAINNTISTALNLNGSSSGQIFFGSSSAGSQAPVLGSMAVTASWTGFRDISFSSGSKTATNSMDLGNNANIVFGGGASGGCVLGGWLLWRDMPEHMNDNFPAWIEKAG